ncbi:MAG: hypothetical protein AB1469_03385 [Pseudomonadota bacterium]
MSSSPSHIYAEEEDAAAGVPSALVQNSLALKLLNERLRPDKRYHFLDIGPALQENIDFCSQYAGKVYIEDLYYTLSLRAASASAAPAQREAEELDEPPSPEEVFYRNITECLLPYGSDTRFDVIFTWDLFNYLAREPLQQLIGRLSKFCNPGAYLFALVSTRVNIPSQPLEYRIIGQDKLIYGAGSSIERPHPRYREVNLLKMMPGFRTDKSFLLRNGIQEYLFVYK